MNVDENSWLTLNNLSYMANSYPKSFQFLFPPSLEKNSGFCVKNLTPQTEEDDQSGMIKDELVKAIARPENDDWRHLTGTRYQFLQ